jgi:predicted benzoate:H+ symporter BenE
MRGRFAFRIKKARLQAICRGPDGHPTITKKHLGAIGTTTVASIDSYLGTAIIQIAIAGGTG